MPITASVFKVFVAGPGDVGEQRQAVAESIEIWNQGHSDRLKIVMRAVGWEQTRPEMGDDPQAIINRQTSDNCDALIAVFDARLGTATPRAISGAVEEIERAIETGKDVMVYFSSGDIPRRGLSLEQFDKLERFKISLGGRGLLGEYSSLDQLRNLLSRHLTSLGYDFEQRIRRDLVSAPSASGGSSNERIVLPTGIERESSRRAAAGLFAGQVEAGLANLPVLNVADTVGCFLDEMYPETFQTGRFRLARLEPAVIDATRQVGHRSFLSTYTNKSAVDIAKMNDGLLYFSGDMRVDDDIRFEFWELKDSGLLFSARRMWEEGVTRGTEEQPFLSPDSLLHHVAGGIDTLIRLYSTLGVDSELITWKIRLTGTQGRALKDRRAELLRRDPIAQPSSLTWTHSALLEEWKENASDIGLAACQHFHERFSWTPSDDSVRERLSAVGVLIS